MRFVENSPVKNCLLGPWREKERPFLREMTNLNDEGGKYPLGPFGLSVYLDVSVTSVNNQKKCVEKY